MSATGLSIESGASDYTPVSPQDGFGKARRLFGEQLPVLPEEFNATLVE